MIRRRAQRIDEAAEEACRYSGHVVEEIADRECIRCGDPLEPGGASWVEVLVVDRWVRRRIDWSRDRA